MEDHEKELVSLISTYINTRALCYYYFSELISNIISLCFLDQMLI